MPDTLWEHFLKSKKLYLLTAAGILILLGIFHLYSAYAGILDPWRFRGIHLISMLLIVFFSNNVLSVAKSEGRERFPIWDVFFLLLVIAVGVYMAMEYKTIIIRYMGPTKGDIVFGTILIILVLEATRRVVGMPLVILSILLMSYSYFGKFIPGTFGHRGFSYSRLIEQMFVQTNGILGIPLGAASVFIIIFIMFGAFLLKSGAGDFFLQFAYALAGRYRGGPAKTAVVASALMGTISGSAVANVVTTGSFTIPLMKSSGMRPQFAAATEATASMGGAIMPPVMSAATFVIAEFLGVPYRVVMVRALIPALLFFTSIFSMIHLEALKTNLLPMKKSELPSLGKVLKTGGHQLLIVLLLLVLLAEGMSPMRAGLFAIVLVVLLAALRKSTRMSVSDIISAIELGVRNTVTISIICAAAGIVVGAINLSGLGVKFSSFLYELGGGNVFLLLLLTAVSCLILGMGMPIVPAYIIVSALGVPALMSAGMPEVVAHMFVFYFAVISGITPPVALDSYAAAGIAGESPTKVAGTALRIGLVAFIVPFMFAYDNRLLLLGGTVFGYFRVLSTALIGVFALACGLQSFLLCKFNWIERLLAFTCALVLIYPTIATDAVGLGAMVLLVGSQFIRHNRLETVRSG